MSRAIRWVVPLGLIVLIALAIGVFLGGSEDRERPVVGITQIVSHPGLDRVREGVISQLAERGYVDESTVEILFRNANGDPSLTVPIAQEFVRRSVAVMVPITTPSALAAAKATERIPIVFGGVTDPMGVGLVSDLNHPGGNISGTSDRWPFKQQFEFFRILLPEMRSVGMLYRPGDDVSKIALDAVGALSKDFGFDLVTRPVSNAGDIYVSALALLRGVDAIYTGMDQLVVENLDAVLKAAGDMKKPVLAGDDGSVERGALAATAVDMFRLGELTGDMVADVLDGASIGNMPVRTLETGQPVLNEMVAARLGIEIGGLNVSDVKLVR